MVILNGLRVEEFCHPEDRSAQAALNKAKWLREILSWAVNQQTQLQLQLETLGNDFAVSPSDMPELYGLLEDVCRTLDYAPVPRMFLRRSTELEVDVFAGEPGMVMIPTYAREQMDDDMLRFQFGRAITALKAGTRQIALAVAAVNCTVGAIPVARQLVMPLLADWHRKSQLTMDRGGLLACQDANAACRTLMRLAGMPANLSAMATADYIRAYQSGSALTNAAQYAKTILRLKPWCNDRLVELCGWIQSGGYDDIIEEYE